VKSTGHPDRFDAFRTGIEERTRKGRLRVLQEIHPELGTPFVHRSGERLLNFSSNDYLGLATDPEVIEGAVRAAQRYGGGSGSSRLVCGGSDLHNRLESGLAELTSRPSALLFASGFQANTSVIPALTSNRRTLVVCDRRSHASVLHGCQLARVPFRRFRHNDPDHLDSLLAAGHQSVAGPAIVITESIFSVDGDRAPLADICDVADRHGALLMVDDAHAVGVFGRSGEGLAAAHPRIDVLLGTLGKAFGAAGAFVTCSELVRSHLVNFCGGVIYSTAPPPAAMGAAEAALRKIRSGALRQGDYLDFVRGAHARLASEGFDTTPSDTQIVPVQLGDDRSALVCAGHLAGRGILAVPIRPPTVPEGTARLRISFTRLHTAEHLELLVQALGEARLASAPT
jgi:8-amino-7-oxononanoate synthase